MILSHSKSSTKIGTTLYFVEWLCKRVALHHQWFFFSGSSQNILQGWFNWFDCHRNISIVGLYFFALSNLLNGVYNRSTSLAYILLHHIYSLEKANVHIVDILYLQSKLRVCWEISQKLFVLLNSAWVHLEISIRADDKSFFRLCFSATTINRTTNSASDLISFIWLHVLTNKASVCLKLLGHSLRVPKYCSKNSEKCKCFGFHYKYKKKKSFSTSNWLKIIWYHFWIDLYPSKRDRDIEREKGERCTFVRKTFQERFQCFTSLL